MTVTVLHMNYDLPAEIRLEVCGIGPGPGKQEAEGWRAAAARELLASGGYHEVATVETDDLERAYFLTQNIDSSWSREPQPGVRPVGPGHIVREGRQYGYKSSEIGDLMVRDGKTYVVDTFGFTEVPLEPAVAPARPAP